MLVNHPHMKQCLCGCVSEFLRWEKPPKSREKTGSYLKWIGISFKWNMSNAVVWVSHRFWGHWFVCLYVYVCIYIYICTFCGRPSWPSNKWSKKCPSFPTKMKHFWCKKLLGSPIFFWNQLIYCKTLGVWICVSLLQRNQFDFVNIFAFHCVFIYWDRSEIPPTIRLLLVANESVSLV